MTVGTPSEPNGGPRHGSEAQQSIPGGPSEAGDVSGFSILGQDGERVLRRESRLAADGTRGVVLVAALAAEHPAKASLERLAHEWELRKELDGAWAARPLALERERGGMALVLEDAGGEPLERLMGRPMESGAFLRLTVRNAGVLGKLHQRGLVHKDVKPANILVNPKSGEIRLTGFGLASRLARERLAPDLPETIAGTLAYMAPEQTGRMNRSVDARSDLYALGVTLYQMLTGELPFSASDPMELVHCHIARQPVPPAARAPGISAAISALVVKLLAKTAEERYQTAAGVAADLRCCLAEWETEGRIEDFTLGQHDTPDRLLIPEKLYGREREVAALLSAFDRVIQGGPAELVLVAGYSGIGKSSVVNELHKALVPPRGLFASGKFDQYKRDIPYSTLAQAFQSLTRRLLAKSDADLAPWRDALREALGANGRLMTDVVPELTLIIGEQPPVPQLPPQDAQLRFQLVFRRFIGVFARPEHPLAMFLDDLQWVDAATLDLLEDLLAQTDVQHLLLIGAYRDNEVDSAHPLTRKLETIRSAGARIEEIRLAPLAREHLGRLIADAMRCEPERAAPLARLMHEKTGGNPFFAIQFMTSLAEEGMLAFDHDAARWSWDLDRIHAKGYTDNVVDLMVGKLSRLPVAVQSALQGLACLGNSAEVATLALVHGTSAAQVDADLWEAVRFELIEHLDGTYKFVHDRVEEAAYSLIPKASRAAAHLRIGRLLATQTPPEKLEEAVFEIVNQLDRGAALITAPDERERVAELNLLAGRRAKASAAYVSAASYFAAGRELLSEQCWERRYELIFALEIHRAECELLTGNAAAEERLAMLSNHAGDLADLAAVASLRELLHTMHNQFDRSVQVALEYLRQVGVHWPAQPSWQEVLAEYESMWKRLEHRSIDQMAALPLMSDPAARAMVEVLTEIVPAAYFTDMNLCCLVVCRIANLSFEHGNSNGSVYAYSLLGFLLRTRFGNHGAGFQFGKLALDLAARPELNRFRARAYFNFAYTVNPWTNHIRTGRTLLRQGLTAAEETGDLSFAAYSHYSLMTDLIASGDPLDQVQREGEGGLNFVAKARFGLVVDIMTAHLRFVRTLRGLTPELGSFNDAEFDEDRFEQHLEADPGLANPTCVYWIRKLQARFYAGDCSAALRAAAKAEPLLWTSPSSFEPAEYHFYAALARAAHCDFASEDERRLDLEALAIHSRQIVTWAENCPANFDNRAALVAAETARVEGRDLEAMHLYERAIRSCREHSFVQNEGLANELAARFYAARGFETTSHAYLREARHCYLRWGADGKVKQLDRLHPRLKDESPVPGPTSTIGAPVEHLELETVIKVSQAIAGEIVLEKLLDTLMRVALEEAGAERGLLIIPRGTEIHVQAEATTSGEAVIVRLEEAIAGRAAVPESVLSYVMRTGETVVLDDASTDPLFSADAYVRDKHARSLLCLPLRGQAKLTGVLYLENNLAPRVFTPARIAVLRMLASQAAMSLENTRLYRDLAEREAKIRRLVDANIIGIFIWDFEGRIIEANDALLRMVDYDREDLVSGRIRWTELTPPEWRERTAEMSLENRMHGHAGPFEKECFRKDGSRVPVLIGSATFEGSANEGVAFVLDLTERKRAAEALQEAQGALARVNRATTLGMLGASIAHEVNQPLGAITSSAAAGSRWLSAQPPDLDKARRSLERIANDGRRASEVINRLRALVKRQEPRKDRFDLNEAILEVLALTDHEVRRNDILVETALDADLPQVEGDRIQIQQIILNLVVNAIEAMSTVDDRPRQLAIGSAREGAKAVRVEVRDSGPGFEASHAERLFEAFYTTKAEGTGLGLSISRAIIEAHGGRLWVSQNEPRGAAFCFSLPVEAAAA